MHEAITYEKAFNEFFLNVKAVLAASEQGDVRVDKATNQLALAFAAVKVAVHAALCDNIDTVGSRLPTSISVSTETLLPTGYRPACRSRVFDQRQRLFAALRHHSHACQPAGLDPNRPLLYHPVSDLWPD